MTDIIDVEPDVIKVKVKDNEYLLERLSVYDKAELLRADRRRRKTELEHNLKSAGIDGEQHYAELQAFDEAEVTEKVWQAYVNDPVNEGDIHLASLRITYSEEEADKIVRRIPPSFGRRAQLCGMEVFDVPATTADAAGGEPADPNQNPPATYGTPATTESTTRKRKPSSGTTSPVPATPSP